MIDILFNCFNSLNVYLILFIAFILYLYNRKRTIDELRKIERQTSIDSIPRRGEECYATYPNGWLPVYDSHDLKKGDVKPIFALGRDLVVYRGTSGKVYVFDAYCPHLGANLGFGGTVIGDDIKCHFHGWEFDNQGDCKAIPGLEDKAIPKTRINKWCVQEVNNFIYVWHHSDGKEPDWFSDKYEQAQQMVYRGKFVTTLYCHVQDIIENVCDIAHYHNIHPSILDVHPILRKFISIVMDYGDCLHIVKQVTHQVNSLQTVSITILGFIKLRAKHSLHENGPASLCSSIHLKTPLFEINLFQTMDSITVGPLHQSAHFKVYSDPTIAGLILTKIALRVFAHAFDQDKPVWDNKVWKRNPIFTKLDRAIVHSRRWYKQNFYQEYSKVN